MELKTITKTTKQLEIEVIGENETLLNPITQVLLQHKDVEYASTITKHPASSTRHLYIRLKAGTSSKPETVLKEAVREVKKQVASFKKEFEKALSSVEKETTKKASS
jgi:DNA-directed RNA polymerase subunit L